MIKSEIQFLSPGWLWLLLPFWLYLVYWFTAQKNRRDAFFTDFSGKNSQSFYHPFAQALIQESRLKNLRQKVRPFRQKMEFLFAGLGMSLLIIAMAEPVLMGERLPDPPAERDIVFLVDTSVSMQLKDYLLDGKPVKRMDLLRKLLSEFAAKMAGEHLSVIIFAEQPFMLVPLSNDQYLIQRMLGRVTTSLAGRYTAVGDALLMALKEAQKQPDRHQTFILFSDADESRGKVRSTAAAKLVAEKNIPVFSIAIGSSQKADGEVQGGLYQAVNLALLEEISQITGGKMYQVHDSEAMQEALKNILSQRQNQAEVIPQYQRKALYFYPLMLAMALFLLPLLFLLLTRWQASQKDAQHA